MSLAKLRNVKNLAFFFKIFGKNIKEKFLDADMHVKKFGMQIGGNEKWV